jgi:AcrR family transcriptional regulator
MSEAAQPAVGRREARKAERRAAIVEVAWRHFLDRGYAGTSMSAIVEEMGGSKGTLWSYFASKEELLAATIDAQTGSFQSMMTEIIDSARDMTEVLTILARKLVARVTSPDAIALQRLIIGEVERFPEIGRIFYDRGPGVGRALLSDYIDRQVRAGVLPECDPDEAAQLFLDVCTGGYHQRLLWGVTSPDDDRAECEAALAVRQFLRCYPPQ